MRRLQAFFLAAVVVFLALTSPAAASFDPVGGGSTTIKLDPAFRALLAKNGVRLRVKAGAKMRRGSVVFPVSGGLFDPGSARGTVDHSGTLVFAVGKHEVPLRALVFRPSQKTSPFSAKFGGGQLKITTTATLSLARSGFGSRAKVRGMRLSRKVAIKLGKKLRLHGVFHAGEPFGQASTTIQPASATILPTGRAAFAPSAAFMAKLQELSVSLNPIAPAELGAGPQFTFPIAGGSLAPSAVAGTLSLGGTLEFLELGSAQIFWVEPTLELDSATVAADVDEEPTPTFRGKAGRLAVLNLGIGATSSDPRNRTIAVAGAPVALSAETAAAFNRAFGEPQGRGDAFAGGDTIGSVSFSAVAQ